MPKIKLTPSEKRLQRIERRQLKKQQKDERQRQLKRDHLQRELTYSRKTLKKYEKDWMDMLNGISLKNLRYELHYIWRYFEHIIDGKDFTISLLMDELAYAEEQYLRNFSGHVAQIENLYQLFWEYLNLLRDDFRSFLEAIQTSLDEFAMMLQTTHQTNCDYLKTLIYCSDQERINQEKIMKIEYYGQMEMEQSKNTANLEKLKTYLEHRYQHLFTEMANFVRNFQKTTKKRRTDYERMKQIDDSFKNLMDDLSKRIQQNYDWINNLKEKFFNLKRIGDRNVAELTTIRDSLLADVRKLKYNSKMQWDNDQNQLIALIQCCKNTEEYLLKLKRKGEALLNFMPICQRLETAEEILPSSIVTCDEINYQMELFWQRFGVVSCENLQISKEISILKQQNFELNQKLKQNFNCNKTIRQKPQNINTIDCNLVMKNYEIWQKYKSQNS